MDQTIKYETIIIAKPDINQETQKQIYDNLHTSLDRWGGREVRFENWGKRKLAYPIKKSPKGIYFFISYLGNNKIVREIERSLKLTENILRVFTKRLCSGDAITEADLTAQPVFQAGDIEEASSMGGDFEDSILPHEDHEEKKISRTRGSSEKEDEPAEDENKTELL
jgi:small subunit ribosomal protein S6